MRSLKTSAFATTIRLIHRGEARYPIVSFQGEVTAERVKCRLLRFGAAALPDLYVYLTLEHVLEARMRKLRSTLILVTRTVRTGGRCMRRASFSGSAENALRRRDSAFDPVVFCRACLFARRKDLPDRTPGADPAQCSRPGKQTQALDRLPTGERVRDGAAIHILELTTHRHPMRNA